MKQKVGGKMISIYSGDEAREKLRGFQVPQAPDEGIVQTVSEIIIAVRERGDAAILELAKRFGDETPENFALTQEEIQAALSRLPAETRNLLERAAGNIRAFAGAVMGSLSPVRLERGEFTAGLDLRPVERAGCYVPGGRYPLPSTALMTAITARAAGVEELAIASPRVADEVVYAGTLAGVETFYRIGGAQAVAAFAFGTESVKAVEFIAGPGNAYVTEAKRQLQGLVGIDLLAGPSEVAIIADAPANPRWLALDMLAQCEHDPQARAWLLTDSRELAESVAEEIKQLAGELQLPGFIDESIAGGAILVLEHMDDCAAGANQLAPEHLQLSVADPQTLRERLTNYGALFVGYQACVPFGDYMAGPNHTLPTGRTARFAGGLSPLTFLRAQSYLEVGSNPDALTRDSAVLAQIEGLTAHAAAARARRHPGKRSEIRASEPDTRP